MNARNVMRPAWLVLFGVCVAAAGGCSKAAPGKPGAIFRDVDVGWRQHLVLGDSIRSNVRPLLVPDGPGRYHLRAGAFGGAEWIGVETGAGGRVVALHFRYRPPVEYAGNVREYAAEIGRPSATMSTADSTVTRWQDARTVFELVRTRADVASHLYDREHLNDRGKP